MAAAERNASRNVRRSLAREFAAGRYHSRRDDDPWDVEATVEPLAVGDPAPRPPNIRNVDEVEPETVRHQTFSYFTPGETTRLTGLAWEKVAPSHRGSVPHCHSAEEEVFVVLEGAATLELWPRDGDVEETHLRPGHLVGRPPGTKVSHSFRAGPEGVTMLVYGTRDPNDMCWYPRSRKISWRGLGVVGRIETLDYFDGEPVDDD